MRVASSSALLGALILTGACFAYRPAPLVPAAGSRVRIVLASTTTVTTFAVGREDDRRAIPGVVEASGRIHAVAGDTVAIRLGELRTVAGAVPDVSGQVALVPTAQIARIEERRFQAGTTLLAAFGFSFLALGVFIVLITVTLVKAV